MQDIVVASLLKSFVENFGLENLGESKQFERFCFFSILNNELNHSLTAEDIEGINVGENKGIDGITFTINGKIVRSLQEFEEIRNSRQKLTISLYFFQSKTSDSFKDVEIGGFLDAVIDFLNKEPKYPFTNETQNYHTIYKAILDKVGIIKDFHFYAYYCSTGDWVNGNSCEITFKKKKDQIELTRLFNKINVEPIDKSKIIDLYKKASNPISAEFEFSEKVEIKDIIGIEEAFIGLVPFREFKKLIIDPNNGNLRSLFYDNVRDFLGIDNEVNEKIKETLEEKKFTEFSLLNNGITIIASENRGRTYKFDLHNYQIVNGCQTSNVLYECRNVEGIDNALIPIKVVITQDEELRDRIILSTNSQSKIEEEELLALTKFQKRLEEFYSSSNDGLNYERRNNQYANKPHVKKKTIVDIREQIKSFVGMFFDEPHEVAGYFGRVYKERKSDIFLETHLLEPYLISGLIQFQFKEFLSSQEIERKYNKARYHSFMLFRMISETEKFKKEMLSSQKKKKYFDDLLTNIRDKEKCLTTFLKTFQIIDKLQIEIQESKQIYNKSITNDLKDIYHESNN